MSLNRTGIEWVRNPDGTPGYTWNPITGCLNHDNNGICRGGGFPCYAYRLAHGRLKSLYLANPNGLPKDKGILAGSYPTRDPFYPRFWEERFWDLYNASSELTKPRGIFVCDMSDLFGIGVPEEWTRQVIHDIGQVKHHRFYLLTKQPQNLIKWTFPDNCWVGVTVCNDNMLSSAILYLHNIKAKVKYISFEPLLGQMKDLSFTLKYSRIVDWLIIGAQTKPYKPPDISWVGEIVEAADKAGVKVFLKDNLRPLLIDDKGYPHAGVELLDRVIETGTWQLRQEMPK